MIKKWGSLLIVIMMIFSIIGCRDNNSELENSGISNEIESSEADSSYEELEEWGVWDSIPSMNKNNEVDEVWISFPSHACPNNGLGVMGKQVDGTYSIAVGEMGMDSPVVEKLIDIFPTCFDELQFVVEDCFGPRYDEFALTLTGAEEVTIDGREMARFTGTLSMVYKGHENLLKHWVGYAQWINSIGAYIYTLSLDDSVDQSLGKQIEYNAYMQALYTVEDQD